MACLETKQLITALLSIVRGNYKEINPKVFEKEAEQSNAPNVGEVSGCKELDRQSILRPPSLSENS